MDTKMIAVIYEMGNEKVFKLALDKLLFGNRCFTFICVDPKVKGSYSFSEGNISQQLRDKLDTAQELYFVNPKGTISQYMFGFLSYIEETGKPVHYMYKYCYKDCKNYSKSSCAQTSDYFFLPAFHKMLPACRHYVRIYDDLFVQAADQKDPGPAIGREATPVIPAATAADADDMQNRGDIATTVAE